MSKRVLLLLLAVMSVGMAYAQTGSLVTGKLVDSQTKEPLIGATVVIKGTTKATSTALDGSFKLSVPEDGATLVFSYVGYVNKQLTVAGAKKLGQVTLDPSASTMKEVVITGTQAVAISRQTPIAASSVSQVYIEEKGAGQEFPELLKATPGVMATRTGGGYGDSRVSIRGFSSNNVALLINGLPVNDVEAGKIYWNDWAGLSDVTASMQVQRGLSASVVAVPSLGGTINIITRSTETQEGGSILQGIGSYNDLRTAVSYSTGLSDKGWASSFMLSRRSGDGNAEGLQYIGYSYFLNVSKRLTPTQSLSFNLMGAAQSHGQRYTYNTINTYRNAPQGIRYNSDWGYYGGDVLSGEVNFYNKPFAQLNHDWKINDKSSLATVAYASMGRGGATFSAGALSINPTSSNSLPRFGDMYAPIDWGTVAKANAANADGVASSYIQTVKNDHEQYGLLSTYKRKVGDINVLAGVDMRYYVGRHYYEMDNLLGAQYYVENRNGTTGDLNNPLAHIRVGDKFNSNYTYNILSEGVYLQAEYVKNDLSAFVTVAGNNTGNKRIDYFNYLNTDPTRESKYVNFLGYQAKGGANYNLDAHNNVFANIGYLQRAPLVGSVFLNRKNDINPDAVPEKLLSYELGYGYSSAVLSANVNLYRSTYKDRSITPRSIVNTDNSISTANISGVNELHQGVELDMKYRPIKEVTFSGMLSIGDWHYMTDAGPVTVTNDQGKTTTNPKLNLKGLKVGDAAQTTAALGVDVQVLPQVKIGANYNYYGNYNAYFDPSKINDNQSPKNADGTPKFRAEDFKPYKLPNYNLLDLNIVYRFKLAGLNASFIGNVNNVLDTKYISDAYDQNPLNLGNQTPTYAMGVFYGIGRTYTTTLKIKF